MPRIAIVADSTCDAGPAALAALGVDMVPLKGRFGETVFQDWVDFTPATGTQISSASFEGIGSVVGTHVGPRTVGVGYMPH